MPTSDDDDLAMDTEALRPLRTIVAPAVLVFIHWLLCMSLHGMVPPALWMTWGVTLSQPHLLATVGILSTQPFPVRYPVAFALQVLLIYSCIYGSWQWPQTEPYLGWEILVLLLTLFFLAHVPLLILRRLRWRLADSAEHTRQSPRQESQFRVRDLLIWTAGMAVILSLGCMLLPTSTLEELLEPKWQILIWSATHFVIAAPAMFVLLAVLVSSRRARWALFITVLGASAGLTMLAPAILVTPQIFAEIVFGPFANGLLTGLVLRLAGLRFQRIEPRPSTLPETLAASP